MSRRVSARAWFYSGEGFGQTLGNVPSPETVRKADHAMALTAAGLCPGCGLLKDLERESVWCAKCDGKEDA